MFECLKAMFRKPAKPRTPQDELVDVVAAVVANNPNDWVKGQHHWKHEGLGFSIWVANEAYGIGLSTDGENASPNSMANNVKLTNEQQNKLWNAVANPMTAANEEAARVFAEEVISRVINFYSKGAV